MNFLYCLKKKIFSRFTSDLNKIYTQNWKPAREKKKDFSRGLFLFHPAKNVCLPGRFVGAISN